MPNIDALIERLKTGDYYSRSTAARALGQLGGPKACAALIEALKDEDDWVREYAAEALGKLGCADAVTPLGTLIRSGSYKVRSAAAEALGKIGGEEARALLEPLRDDDDSWVRDAVRGALEKLDARLATPDPAAVKSAPQHPAAEPEQQPAQEADAPLMTFEDEEVRTAGRPAAVSRMMHRRSPRELVEQITQGSAIKYKAIPSGFVLRVPVGGGRYQKVRLKFDSTDEDGSPIIQIFTVIGPAQPKHYRWALTLNPAFSYGGLGLVTMDNKEFLAIVNTLLEENIDTTALEKSVWTLARKGDELEKKLIQKDSW
ncbi:MAG: hypothetical protein Kow0099_14630 [Candidatus Abyssubacteria bacterium]